MTFPLPSYQSDYSTSLSANAATSSSLDAARATTQLLAAQDADTRQAAARAVAAACDNWDDDDKIAARDAIRPLAEMLRASHGEAEAAALALWKLARNAQNNVFIAKAGAIPPLVAILQKGTDIAKENAAGALWDLAENNENNKVSIAKAGAIPPLVALLLNGTDVAKANAAAALDNLATDDDNKVSIAKAGAIPPLIAVLQEGSVWAPDAADLLCKLSYS